MHEMLAGYVDRGELAGVIALVARRGDVHVDVVGRKETDGGLLSRDAIFRIASMSKPVTAAAAMILVEDGRLRLDEPVDRLLPELANRRVLRQLTSAVDDTVPAQRPILVRDLLTFTMGMGMLFAPPGTLPIQNAIAELGLADGPPGPQTMPPPDEWLRRVGTLPLMHQPGERWMYHTGADVLGILIARAAGQSFESFLQDRLFGPLGMKDSGFWVRPEALHRLVTSYYVDPATGKSGVYDRPDGQWSRPPTFASGGGGMVSTADDFLAFSRMLLNRGQLGKARVLSVDSVEQMMRDQLTAAQKAASNDGGTFFDDHGWGFGMSVLTGRDAFGSPGTVGWDGGLGTSWRTDPGRQAVAILMTQQAWSSPEPPPVCRDFWRAASEAIAF